MRSFLATLTCLIGLFPLDNSYPADIKITGKWLSCKSDHFTLYGNAGQSDLVATATRLEQFRHALVMLSGLRSVKSSIPVHVFVFKDQAAFSPFSLVYQSKRQELGGYFMSREDAIYLAVDAEVDDVIYHEYAHFFLHNNLPDIPLWFNEGFAEYFSSFAYEKNSIDIGLPNRENIPILRDMTWMTFQQLFTVENLFQESNDLKRRLFYAQSWALVHFLLHAHSETWRLTELSQFITLLAKGTRPLDALQSVYQVDAQLLDKEVNEYITRYLLNSIRINSKTFYQPTISEVKPMAVDEVNFRLGDLLAHQGEERWAEARELFDALVARNPGFGKSYGGLGYLCLQKEEYAAASGYLTQAVTLTPEDAWLQWLHGHCLISDLQNRKEAPDSVTVNTVLLARSALQKAMTLDSTFIESWADFGRTFLISSIGPRRPGILALETALSRMPHRMDIALNLLELYLRNNDSSKVAVLYEKVIAPRADFEQKKSALERIAWSELKLASELMQNGRYEAAQAKLTHATSLTQDPEVQRQAQELLQYLEKHKSIDKLNSAMNKLKIAVNHVNAKEYKQALELAKQATNECADSRVLKAAADMEKEIARRKQIDLYNAALAAGRQDKFKQSAQLLRQAIAANADPQITADARKLLQELDKYLPD